MSDDALIEATLKSLKEIRGCDAAPEECTCEDDARAALAAIRKTHAVVPREPTMDMKYEGTEAASCNIGLLEARKVYRAMLLAGENHDASK